MLTIGRRWVGDKKTLHSQNLPHIILRRNLAQLYFTWRRSKKTHNHVTHLLSSASIRIFSMEISNFHNIRKYRYTSNLNTWFLILFSLFESLKIFLINMFAVLMTSAKMATLGLFKEKLFWSKVMSSKFLSKTSPTKFYHMTQIILYMWSFYQSLVTVAFIWEKLS